MKNKTNSEKCAEKWLEEHGFTYTLLKQLQTVTKYEVSKDGITDKFDIPVDIKNPEGYMEMYGEGFKAKKHSIEMEKILEEIDKLPTCDTILCDGELLDATKDYEQYYSDSSAGEYQSMKIIKYDGKLYVYKEKVAINRLLDEKRECIAFYELKA